MIVADGLDITPAALRVPVAVAKRSSGVAIFVEKVRDELPGDSWASTASDWIAVRHAWPHHDPSFAGKKLLTLCIVGDHEVGDARSAASNVAEDNEMHHMRPGALCVVDPMVLHWLAPRSSWVNAAAGAFVGLQWLVPAGQARDVARMIVSAAGGRWREQVDARYAKWRPA